MRAQDSRVGSGGVPGARKAVRRVWAPSHLARSAATPHIPGMKEDDKISRLRRFGRGAAVGVFAVNAAVYTGGEAAITVRNGMVDVDPLAIADIQNWRPEGLRAPIYRVDITTSSTAVGALIASDW